MAATCAVANCTVASGVAFPPDSIPLAMCTANAGVWDATGCVDFRAVYSAYRFVGGPGVSVVSLNGTVTFSADPAAIAAAPAQ